MNDSTQDFEGPDQSAIPMPPAGDAAPPPAWAPTGHEVGAAPTEPGIAPTQPGVAPAYPGMAPTYPGMAPTQPGMAPTYPGAPAGWNPPTAPTPQAGWTPPTAPSAQAGWTPPVQAGTGGGWVPPGGMGGMGGWAASGAGWPAPPAPVGPKKQHRSRPYVVTAVLVAGATLAGVGIGHAAWSSSPTSATALPSGGSSGTGGSSGSGSQGSGGSSGASPFSQGSGAGSTSSASGGPSDVSAIASGVDPGLVDINTSLSYQGAQAAGTGMVVTSTGEVITNNHVINGATTISVTDVGNGKTYGATVVGYSKTQDIAVLQLHKASGLQTVSFASGNVSSGEAVVGIGNAGGAGGKPSAAGGSVTATGQTITASDSGDGTSEQLNGLIQVNADIQPGDSGGPLVTSSGRVIGIDTAASADSQFQTGTNQGYAIPIGKALTVAKQILAGQASGVVHIGSTAFLGVEVSSGASSSGGQGALGGLGQLGPSSGTQNSPSQPGATIVSVVPNGSAAQAGLAAGDVITGIGSKTVNSPSDLTSAMSAYHPGDSVQLQWVDSSGNQQSGTVHLASGPPQ